MFRTTALLAFIAVCAASASAETRKMKLLNPVGTTASDAKVIAVLVSTGAMVDHELKALPFHTMNGQRQPSPFKDVANDDGAISFDVSAYAVVAQNEQSFVFVPSQAFAELATLRPWAEGRS
jgi:hypothetical protein